MAALLGLNLKAAINRVSSCLGLFKHGVLHFNLESFALEGLGRAIHQSNPDSISLDEEIHESFASPHSQYSRNNKGVEATVLDEYENQEKV